MKLKGNKTFTLQTYKANAQSLYIDQVKWNGKLYGKNYISYQMIMQGGKLEFWLTDKPTHWGALPANSPTGLTQ